MISACSFVRIKDLVVVAEICEKSVFQVWTIFDCYSFMLIKERIWALNLTTTYLNTLDIP
ncbi:hypothetical protein T12_1712 [Trichinella patagoniensis]|uniref:Uncharacterized protein n=1 Tax=Trichinella patagoniensis TaxID=990121 RepID=A0A0V0Z5M8_9BILA|nr:hypothetical protein T12_1712 [Trichinella patagoniensis]